MTPGNERSERDVMTATRLGRSVRQKRTGLAARFPSRGRRKIPLLPRLRCVSGSRDWRWPRAMSAGCSLRDTDPDGLDLRLLARAGTYVGGDRLLDRWRGITRISQSALAGLAPC